MGRQLLEPRRQWASAVIFRTARKVITQSDLAHDFMRQTLVRVITFPNAITFCVRRHFSANFCGYLGHSFFKYLPLYRSQNCRHDGQRMVACSAAQQLSIKNNTVADFVN